MLLFVVLCRYIVYCLLNIFRDRMNLNTPIYFTVGLAEKVGFPYMDIGVHGNG